MATVLTTCVYVTKQYLKCGHKRKSGLNQCDKHINTDNKCYKVDKRTHKVNRLCDTCLVCDPPQARPAARTTPSASVSTPVQVTEPYGIEQQCNSTGPGGGLYSDPVSVTFQTTADQTTLEVARPALQTNTLPYAENYGSWYNSVPSTALQGSNWGMTNSNSPLHNAFPGAPASLGMYGGYSAGAAGAAGAAFPTINAASLLNQPPPTALADTGYAYYAPPPLSHNAYFSGGTTFVSPGPAYGNIPSSSTEPAL